MPPNRRKRPRKRRKNGGKAAPAQEPVQQKPVAQVPVDDKPVAEAKTDNKPAAPARGNTMPEEEAVSSEKAESPVEAQQPEEKAEEEKKQPAAEAKAKPAVKNYHVAHRPDGKWQVKFAKGEKAIKLLTRRKRRSPMRRNSPPTRTAGSPFIKKTAVSANRSIEIYSHFRRYTGMGVLYRKNPRDPAADGRCIR